MSWETESDREWDRQYYGCSCRGNPRVVNCHECDEEYCARCTEHKCAKKADEIDYIWSEETQTDDEITHIIRFRKAGLKKRGTIVVSGWEWDDFKKEPE